MRYVYLDGPLDKLKMYGYTVQIDSECEDSYHSDEKYGEWKEEWNHSFNGIRKGGSDLASPYNLGHRMQCHLVWIIYSEGDSFGWANRREALPLFVTENQMEAMALAEFIEKDYAANRNDRKELVFNLPQSTIQFIFTPLWKGVFEVLDSVEIEGCEMQAQEG